MIGCGLSSIDPAFLRNVLRWDLIMSTLGLEARPQNIDFHYFHYWGAAPLYIQLQ